MPQQGTTHVGSKTKKEVSFFKPDCELRNNNNNKKQKKTISVRAEVLYFSWWLPMAYQYISSIHKYIISSYHSVAKKCNIIA